MRTARLKRNVSLLFLASLASISLTGCGDSHPGDTGVAWSTRSAMYDAADRASEARDRNDDRGASGLGFSNASGRWRFGRIELESPSEAYGRAAAQVQAGLDADAESLRDEYRGGLSFEDRVD